jgi:hypothetical protein
MIQARLAVLCVALLLAAGTFFAIPISTLRYSRNAVTDCYWSLVPWVIVALCAAPAAAEIGMQVLTALDKHASSAKQEAHIKKICAANLTD